MTVSDFIESRVYEYLFRGREFSSISKQPVVIFRHTLQFVADLDSTKCTY